MSIIRGYTEVFSPFYMLEAAGSTADDLIPYIFEFVYEDDEAKQDKLTLVVDNSKMRFRDDPRFVRGVSFKTRFGYMNDLSDTKIAVIRKVSHNFPQNGTPRIQMVARGLESTMAKNASPKNWGSVSSSSIAEKIAANYGFSTEIEESYDSRRQARIQPAGVTPFQYLKSLALVLNWDAYISGRTLHFHPRRFDAPSSLSFTYFTENTGTLLSFMPEVNLDAISGSRSSGTNTKDGKTVVPAPRIVTDEKGNPIATAAGKQFEPLAFTNLLPPLSKAEAGFRGYQNFQNYVAVQAGTKAYDAKGNLRTVVGQKNDGKPLFAEHEEPFLHPTNESDPRVIAAHSAANAQAIDMSATKAKAEFIGSPQLRARAVITIQGVDKQYSGRWRIHKSKHTINATGVYKVSVELRRDSNVAHSSKDGTASDASSKAKPRVLVIGNDGKDTATVVGNQFGGQGFAAKKQPIGTGTDGKPFY